MINKKETKINAIKLSQEDIASIIAKELGVSPENVHFRIHLQWIDAIVIKEEENDNESVSVVEEEHAVDSLR